MNFPIQSIPSDLADLTLDLVSGGVHLLHSPLDVDAEFENTCQATLSEDECVRAKRYKFSKDRRQFVVSRGLLRLILGQHLSVRPESIHFDYMEFGKPFVADAPELKFNLAHSGNHVAFAFCCDAEVGIDIEGCCDRRNPMRNLKRRICSSNELKMIAAFDTDAEIEIALSRLWTAKEAFLKALGTGFQIGPNQIETTESILRGDSVPSQIRFVDETQPHPSHTVFPLPDCESKLGMSATWVRLNPAKSREG